MQWLRNWWHKLNKPCEHEWYLSIEHYPSFTKDQWGCRRCRAWETRDFDDPPVEIELEICDHGKVHTVVRESTLDAEVIG